MDWLPLFFAAVMGFALLMYTILDGYDLGIGMLLPLADDNDKDKMIATIGPFWDANETWIVLGVGVLLMAFPKAHGLILTSLYLPVAVMLLGLILRGVAFDFRVKVKAQHKHIWNRVFFLGSLIASMAQGWMLGAFVMGLTNTAMSVTFSLLISLLLPCLYIMLGVGWLLIKTKGSLFNLALVWGRRFIIPLGLGLFLISVSTPIASAGIALKWFDFPTIIAVSPIPIIAASAFFTVVWALYSPKAQVMRYDSIIFIALIVVCVMCTLGLAYSLFPDIVIGQLDIWESAASRDALKFAFVGTVIAVPAIFAYTVFIYRVFSGKSDMLSYESD